MERIGGDLSEVFEDRKPCGEVKFHFIRLDLKAVSLIWVLERWKRISYMMLHYSLPEIQEELERSILATRLVLQRLPKEPSKDPQNEITNLLHGFVTDLVKHVEGVPDEDGLLQTIRPAQEKFRSEIRATAPEFLPFEKRFKGKKTLEKAKFLQDEEGDEEDEPEEEQASPVEEELTTPAKSYAGSDDDESSSESLSLSSRPRIICIDEVLKRAHQ
jgi:hypothetical protein